jgi:hypothetical protein
LGELELGFKGIMDKAGRGITENMNCEEPNTNNKLCNFSLPRTPPIYSSKNENFSLVELLIKAEQSGGATRIEFSNECEQKAREREESLS